MDFADWLDLQHGLQVESYHIDPPTLEGLNRATYITWNAFALEDELHELMAEVQWKPWAKDIGMIIDRDRALVEFADMLHFMGNIALALDLTADEIAHAYMAKVAINAARQERGYGGNLEKCPNCKRDLEAEGAVEKISLVYDGVTMESSQCAACGWELSREVK